MKNYNLKIILEIWIRLKEQENISDSDVLKMLNEYFKDKSDEKIRLEFWIRNIEEIVKVIINNN